MRKTVLLLVSAAFIFSVSGEAFAQAKPRPSGSAPQGKAQPRKSPPPPPSRGGGSGGGSVSSPSRTGNQNTRPAVRKAVPRPPAPIIIIPHPFYPFGYIAYNPWLDEPSCRYWRSRGFWCDSYWYRHPYRYRSNYSSRYSNVVKEPETGSIRLKVSPVTAKVYIDGVLMGVVDDFDGLTDNLRLEPGYHLLELKADGYQTFSKEVLVVGGKTFTERISLKRN